jgi:hypothetical protein
MWALECWLDEAPMREDLFQRAEQLKERTTKLQVSL